MAKRTFKTNNLVIICEGTETEYPYFEFLANKVRNQFDDIRVIPSPEEKQALDDLRASQKRRKRKLVSENNPRLSYVLKEENEDDIDANYNRYKHAPAKYAREAYLWVKSKEYSEAWAVYDLDDTDDPKHSKHQLANELIDSLPSLHKAFSAYSFEEWLLLYFERCSTMFRNSAYKEGKKHINDPEYDCNSRPCQHKKKCEAECIGDYIGRKGYVDVICKNKVYSKNDGRIYAQAIYKDKKLRHRAYVNAAWSRSLNNKVFYECNPYSDVDKLIMRLLDERIDIHWIKTNEEFTLDDNTFTIKQKNGVLFISHQGTGSCVINNSQLYWCDDDYKNQVSAISGANISFTVDNNDDNQLVLSDRYTILCIKGSNQEFYFENLYTKPHNIANDELGVILN